MITKRVKVGLVAAVFGCFGTAAHFVAAKPKCDIGKERKYRCYAAFRSTLPCGERHLWFACSAPSK